MFLTIIKDYRSQSTIDQHQLQYQLERFSNVNDVIGKHRNVVNELNVDSSLQERKTRQSNRLESIDLLEYSKSIE